MKTLNRLLCVVGIAAAGLSARAEKILPYLNPDLSIEERLDDLVARTTMQQKIKYLRDLNPAINEGDVHLPPFPRAEALHGLSFPKHNNTTVWPSPICLGGTWDDQLIYDMAVMISDEARAQYHHGPMTKLGKGPLIYYAPGVYLARDPRWGRYQECFSEDSFMVSRFAVAYVKGMQGNDSRYLKTACTTKCFAVYNKEENRFGYNAEVSERWLRDYYFQAHKACFQEANCRSTMTAYNALNGIPCSGNKWLLTDVLRDEWGFDGFVMEDASATMAIAKEDAVRGHGQHDYTETYVEAAALALNAGMDFMLSESWREGRLEEAIKQGLTTEDKLNTAFRRVIRVMMECGIFDPDELSPWKDLPFSTLCQPKHTAHARMAAQKGIVLLKNDPAAADSKLLPIDRERVKSIAVVGLNANTRTLGIYSGKPKHETTVLAGIEKVAGKDITINYVPWASYRTEELVSGRSSSTVGRDGVPGWKVEFFNNTNFEGEPVFSDVVDFVQIMPDTKLPAGITVPNFSVRWSSDINPPQDGTYRFNVFSDDYVSLTVDGKEVVKAVNPHWRIERRGECELRSDRAYDIVLEYRNLPERVHVPNSETFIELFWEKPAAASSVDYGEVEAARRSDLVVAVLGLMDRDEGEGGHDRIFPNVSQDQIEMLKKVAAVNPNIVTVLINGSPLTLDTVKDLSPAILEAWYPGQAGIAVADLLFGDANPSGHLPSTIYRSWEPIGTIDEFEIDRGKRTYMYADNDNIVYPFGFGLSYTDFEFSNLKPESKTLTADGEMNVAVTVANTGKLAGSDVVQLYAREAEQSEGRPRRRLVGFKRVDDLNPGEKRDVVLTLQGRNLEYWDAGQQKMRVRPGTYVLELGESSEQIIATTEITVR